MLVSIKTQESLPEDSLCLWNGEGCAVSKEKDNISQENNVEYEDLSNELRNAIGELKRLSKDKSQAFDGTLEDKTSGASFSYNRDEDRRGGKKCLF